MRGVSGVGVLEAPRMFKKALEASRDVAASKVTVQF